MAICWREEVGEGSPRAYARLLVRTAGTTVQLAEAVRSAEKGFAFSLEMGDESDL